MKKLQLWLGIIMVLTMLWGCVPEPEKEIVESRSVPIVTEQQPIISREEEEIIKATIPSLRGSEPELKTNIMEEAPAPAETIEEPKPCGSFFDAYTRITGGPQDSGDVRESDLAALLAVRMKEHDVGCAVLVGMDVTDFGSATEIRESINYYFDILRQHPGLFTSLLDIDADSASQISVTLIDDILGEAKGKIAYRGFGEISFVDPGPWKNKKFTDQPLPEIVEFMGSKNMVVAAHIARGQTSDLKAILTQYPDTKILVHGYPDGIKDLLVKHKNLYYAAELEIMLGEGTYSCSISFSNGDVDNAIRTYAPIIAAAPEQVLWATNAHSKCHFQPGFYGKLIEFSEKLVERLPEDQRKGFAHRNAEQLFGIG